MKADAQQAKWEDQWARQQAAATKEAKKALSEKLTEEAESALTEASSLLLKSLGHKNIIDWKQFYDHSKFGGPKPIAPKRPSTPVQPAPQDFRPQLGVLGHLIPAIRKRREADAMWRFEAETRKWESSCKQRIEVHREKMLAYQSDVDAWQERESQFYRDQAAHNSRVDMLRQKHKIGEVDAVEKYADLVLANSPYPAWYNRDWELDYQEETKILIVNYRLPNPEDIPILAAVRYVAARDSFDKKLLIDTQKRKHYDSIVYQITLRTLHELFEADRETKNIFAVVFNGITESVSNTTGQPITSCICSIQVGVEEFSAINLAAVDPKACFKGLKGVAASSLSQLAPVPPLMMLQRDDSRFIPNVEAGSKLQEGENIAAMSWQDFEHLIRELFEREFSQDGCEVRVTQGSRDGGVDAIVFDPDPIRGGKIVIQAKRYTNTVGVSAVRDLYGTVMNEGAIKGILVTTAQFGPDARKFVANKPLALIDGSGLLHMLSGYNKKLRIDLQEAKETLQHPA
ncbi:MAG: restriction endonuclease [Oceanicaulis sp.]|uniref:restriction endonuclease n=1 Tax=Glycocaulis sp. TaxID=1969725 RepID=UPI0025C309D3|nr:restriction endonuclease [Glycocaulis sp.]MCC5981902.1 restriction endonuclease [Oceanicaulis sp.]MCH8522042.1 restriction endonuclease [Glycocaulis sp.]